MSSLTHSARNAFKTRDYEGALTILNMANLSKMNPSHKPDYYALKGVCHYMLEHFQTAYLDLRTSSMLGGLPASSELFVIAPLYYAHSAREFGLPRIALKLYKSWVKKFDSAPDDLRAEANWGTGIALYEAWITDTLPELKLERVVAYLNSALEYYIEREDLINAALVQCDIFLVFLAINMNLETPRKTLEAMWNKWEKVYRVNKSGEYKQYSSWEKATVTVIIGVTLTELYTHIGEMELAQKYANACLTLAKEARLGEVPGVLARLAFFETFRMHKAASIQLLRQARKILAGSQRFGLRLDILLMLNQVLGTDQLAETQSEIEELKTSLTDCN